MLLNYQPNIHPINPGNVGRTVSSFILCNIAIGNVIGSLPYEKAFKNYPAKIYRGRNIIEVSQVLNTKNYFSLCIAFVLSTFGDL